MCFKFHEIEDSSAKSATYRKYLSEICDKPQVFMCKLPKPVKPLKYFEIKMQAEEVVKNYTTHLGNK